MLLKAAWHKGLGLSLYGNNLYGIDLDKVFIDGKLTDQAAEIVAMLDSYTEISPSGLGLHIIVRAENMDFADKRKGFIEIYNKERYFTMTGNIYNNLNKIEDRQNELKKVYEKYLQRDDFKPENLQINESKAEKLPKKPDSRGIENKSDREYLQVGLEKDRKLFELWNAKRPNGNESSDDQGIINKLAYWCNANEELIYRAFFESPYYLSKDKEHIKKCERRDYVPNTIKKALTALKSTARIDDESYLCSKAKTSGGRIYIYENTSERPNFINPLSNRRRYSFDDIGMGYLFADVYKDFSRYVPETKLWYYYNGRVWRQDLEGLCVARQAKDLASFLLKCAFEIEEMSKREEFLRFVAKVTSNKGRKIMLDEAKSVYPVNFTDFDKDPYIFNCRNCTINLSKFSAKKHSADDLLSKISNVSFDVNAKCERWVSFINEIMQGDLDKAEFLQKALGYTLTGDSSEECFFILYGATTRNGKGTTMETTLYLMGDYGMTAQPESIAQKQNVSAGNASEDLARLKGARFVNMSEPDKGLRLNSAIVKQMSGGDTITARFLHQNSFEYRPEFKLFINTNHLPKINDDSIFRSGRIKLIPFERYFTENEQDKGLKIFFRKPENLSGVFNWFLEGLKMYTTEGLEQPQVITTAIDEYRKNSDSVGLFISECLEACQYEKIKTKKVYEEYKGWCNVCGYSPKNQSNLIEDLRKRGMIRRDRILGNVVFDYILKSECPF